MRRQGLVFDEWYGEGEISQKVNKLGEGYGWNSTVFCTVEEFWGADLSIDISYEEAYEMIHDRILELNPDAEEKVIKKFIL